MLERLSDRVWSRLEELYAIGGGRGANRPGYSAEEDEAHELAAAWMAEAGLELERDGVGNLIGRLHGRRPELPEVWSGSHLDSVPEGGRFDGALGVVAALEAVERAGPGERTLGVVAFRAEETGCRGSRGRCGTGVTLPGAFLEVHVEQGPRLADAGVPLGVVAAIAGYVRGTIVVEGRPGHAGTTPMEARDDALCRAAEVVLAVRDAARSIDGAVATVGLVAVEPGAVNVIPSRVSLSVDARAPDRPRLDELVAAIGLEPSLRVDPVALDGALCAVLREEAGRAGVAALELVSGAGHDAGILAAAGVPSAMLFVRSLAGGISHAPEEDSDSEDVALAIDVLASALARLALAA
jgi:acetylornithine deacetylase/succinyl-diaminopimelate desuccinylase-like protein